MNYVTLFDHRYLTRGLVLYQSLMEHSSKNTQLSVLAMDDLTVQVLEKLNLDRLNILRLRDFESLKLLEIKPTRSPAEYCWTCTPNLLLYAIEELKYKEAVYLDADLVFYDDPDILIDEWRASCDSILLTDHWYSPEYDQTQKSGRFCVQFMGFKNDDRSLKALKWWSEQCLNWCYARHEDGKFGDQKYLDDWEKRFLGVHVLQYRGGGVAPWNVQQYRIQEKGLVFHKPTRQAIKLVFYHFHALHWVSDGIADASTYRLGKKVKDRLYGPYITLLVQKENTIKGFFPEIQFHPIKQNRTTLRTFFSKIWHHLLGTKNIIKVVK